LAGCYWRKAGEKQNYKFPYKDCDTIETVTILVINGTTLSVVKYPVNKPLIKHYH